MSSYARSTSNTLQSSGWSVRRIIERLNISRGIVIGTIITAALVSFEVFNFSTTEYAMRDLLGTLSFAGVHWATILAIAFCGIDFAGIARLFTPNDSNAQPAEVWYLLGAWFLAATMNAMLTWWAVSLALLSHTGLGNEVIGRENLLSGVPIFVAVLVWLIRVLMIGTITLAGARIFKFDGIRSVQPTRKDRKARPRQPEYSSVQANVASKPFRPAPKPYASEEEGRYIQPSIAARPPRRR